MAPQNTCACGCGTPVRGTWARGHAARGQAPAPIPGPDDIGDVMMDVGELVPDEPPQIPAHPPAAAPQPPPPITPTPGPSGGPLPPDEPPAHSKREWSRGPGRPPKAKPGRITVAVRADITAKLRFLMMGPGAIWQARDPLCGGVFMEQVPVTADALTAIVCESADLVAFFTGPGGAFMRWMEVGAALLPVAQVVAAHHVYHTIGEVPVDMQQPGVQYAA